MDATAGDRAMFMPMPHSDLSDLMIIPWTSRHCCFTARNGLTCMIPRQGERYGTVYGGRQRGNIASNTRKRKVRHRPWGSQVGGGSDLNRRHVI